MPEKTEQLSSAVLDKKTLQESLAAAKKDKKKSHRQEMKWAKESLGRALLRIMELKRNGRD